MRSPQVRRRSRVQALVEFALVIPLLIAIMLGIIDMGRAISAYGTVSEAARTAARVAIVDQNVTAIQTAVTGDPRIAWLGLTAANVPAPNYSCTAPYSLGCVVTTTVTYQFQPLTPLITAVLGPITLSSTSSLPIERVYP